MLPQYHSSVIKHKLATIIDFTRASKTQILIETYLLHLAIFNSMHQGSQI